MAFYYKGRYLGETPWTAQASLSRKELQDFVYDYIVRYFDITEVAETVSRRPVTPAEWAEDAMKSIQEYVEAGSSLNMGGVTYRDEGKRPAAKKAPGKKAGPMASNSKKKATSRRR